MESKETSYMLFLFGDYKGGENFVNAVFQEFTPILTNDYIKFVWGDFGVVSHFKTDLPFEDLSEFVNLQLGGMVDQYFLLEKTDKTSAYGPEEIVSYVLDLETKIERPEQPNVADELEREAELDRVIQYFMSSMSDEESDSLLELEDDDDDDNEIELIKIRNAKNKSLTLDQILDKINDEGIQSLSKKEKKQLENYANGK